MFIFVNYLGYNYYNVCFQVLSECKYTSIHEENY